MFENIHLFYLVLHSLGLFMWTNFLYMYRRDWKRFLLLFVLGAIAVPCLIISVICQAVALCQGAL